MSRKPVRIIEAAMFDREFGPVSASELIAMPKDRWGILRDMITDKHNGGDGIEAKCLMCGCNVFIQGRKNEGEVLPYFAHYKGGNPNCPWYHGRTNHMDEVRAAQYQGHQESEAHKMMCAKIAHVVQLDSRYVTHKEGEYLPPTQSSYGRYPDVYAEWKEIGPFVIEFQMSNTFQTEVSQRCMHYDREGIPLVWVLYGIERGKEIPQSFRDVIRRHRNNAFVFDSAASKASYEQKTLVLTCYLLTTAGYLEAPRLVRFDELTIPSNRIPYLEDRLIRPSVLDFNNRRKPWFYAFKQWDKYKYDCKIINNAIDTLKVKIPHHAVALIAAAFSIVANANGRPVNYASHHPNIKAMLNSYLQSDKGRLAPYVSILKELINNTKSQGALAESVWRHFDRITCKQAAEDSPEWQALAYLLPEALDPKEREILAYCHELPEWASPVQEGTPS